MNPDYATTPCLQHGVVAVDGKLIPFAYPTHNAKQAILWNNGQVIDNGTKRLNTNPMNRLDNENRNDQQENFYHTLTPFNNQCDEQSCAPSMIYCYIYSKFYYLFFLNSSCFRLFNRSFNNVNMSDSSSSC